MARLCVVNDRVSQTAHIFIKPNSAHDKNLGIVERSDDWLQSGGQITIDFSRLPVFDEIDGGSRISQVFNRFKFLSAGVLTAENVERAIECTT